MGGPAKIFRPKPKPQPAPQPAPVMTAPKGPTKAEAVQYDKSKRKGRRATILTSSSGVTEKLELAKKTKKCVFLYLKK